MGLGGRPLAAKREDLGCPGVGPRQVERSVGILRQCDRHLRVSDGGVPISSAEMGIAEMRQTGARIGRGKPGAQPGRRHAEVRNGARQVVDVDLEHSSHDEGVTLSDLGLRCPTPVESRGWPAPQDCVRRRRTHTPAPCAPWPTAPNQPRFHATARSPHIDGLVGPTRDDHPVGQRRRRPGPYLSFASGS